MRKFILITLSTLGCLLLPLCINAQSAQEQPVYSFEFSLVILNVESNPDLTAVGWRIPYEFKFLRGENSFDISTRIGETVGPFLYREPLPLVFFKEELNAEGEVIRVPIVTIRNIPENAEKLLIALVPKEDRSQFASQVIDCSTESLPVDHVMLVNFSQSVIAADVSGERSAVSPFGTAVLERKEIRPYKFYLRLAHRGKGDDQWKPLRSSAYPSAPGTRQVFIMYQKSEPSADWRIYEVQGLDAKNDYERTIEFDGEDFVMPETDSVSAPSGI